MQALHSLQADFARALFEPERAPPGDITSHTSKQPKKRFDVYRNNVVLSLTQALSDQFPAIARLLGQAAFRQTAKAYATAHPPRSPLLMAYGDTFGDFLEAFEPLQHLPYLADVARLEWLWVRAFHAADATPASTDQMAAIPPQALEATTFSLHPSLGLLSSPYPAVSIWHTNIADDAVKAIAIDGGGEDALVVRPGLEVEVRRLPPGAFTFIDHLGRGAALGKAAQTATEAAEDFDLQLALTDLVQSGSIVAFDSD